MAGTGAAVGKLLGANRGMRGGLGSAALLLEIGLVAGDLAPGDAAGDVVDRETDTALAGACGNGRTSSLGVTVMLQSGRRMGTASAPEDTTPGVVATNGNFLPRLGNLPK